MCVCVFVRDLKNGCSVLTCILVKTERVLPIGQQFSLAAKIVEKSSNQRWYSLISANCRQRYYGTGGGTIKGRGKDLSLLIFKLKFERAEFEEGGMEGTREESGGGWRELKMNRFGNIIISLLSYPSSSRPFLPPSFTKSVASNSTMNQVSPLVCPKKILAILQMFISWIFFLWRIHFKTCQIRQKTLKFEKG